MWLNRDGAGCNPRQFGCQCGRDRVVIEDAGGGLERVGVRWCRREIRAARTGRGKKLLRAGHSPNVVVVVSHSKILLRTAHFWRLDEPGSAQN
jgi:hypothetical protein